MKPVVDKNTLQKVVVERSKNEAIHVNRYGDMTREESTAFFGVHIADEVRCLLDMGYQKQDAYNIIDAIVNSVKCAIDFDEAWEVEEK